MEFYIDLNKAVLNMGKLVKRAVQVHGQGGKTFTRMQWVDPDSGQAVHEGEHHPDDHERNHFNSLPKEQKENAVRGYFNQDKERAYNFAQHTGMRRDPRHLPQSAMMGHLMENSHKIPMDHLNPHISKSPNESTQPQYVDTSNMKDVDIKTGAKGPLDISKLTQGHTVTDFPKFDKQFKKADELMHVLGHKYDSKEEWNRLFGGITKQGLEHVFSHPDGDFTATLSDIHVSVDYQHGGNVTCYPSFGLYDRDGEKMGDIHRSVSRSPDGSIRVNNDELSLHEGQHGKGVASTIYPRSEQLWRHMSQGKPVHITMVANISIGVHAWANKGFDFADGDELDNARSELRLWCRHNGIGIKDIFKSSGYKSMDDLQHSWQFANLDDGNEYHIDKVAMTDDTRSGYKGEVLRKPMKLGKAFMLSGKSDWYGIKTLNADSVHEEISSLHSKNSKEGK